MRPVFLTTLRGPAEAFSKTDAPKWNLTLPVSGVPPGSLKLAEGRPGSLEGVGERPWSLEGVEGEQGSLDGGRPGSLEDVGVRPGLLVAVTR